MRSPSFAYLLISRTGEASVHSLGAECIFGEPAVCGATFACVEHAIAWLQDRGFAKNDAGVWQKGNW